MKKALIMIAIMLGASTAAFAQNINKSEAKRLKAFLARTAENGERAMRRLSRYMTSTNSPQ